MKLTYKPLLLSLLLIIACEKPKKQILDTRTDVEIESLILKHNNDLIFSSFWSNMSEVDFKRVLQFENNKGTLSEDKYPFKINKNLCGRSVSKDEESVLFNLNQIGKYVRLKFEDEYWVDKQSELYPSEDGTYKAKYYNCIIESLIEHFDSKYERLIGPDKSKIGRTDIFGNPLGLSPLIWRKTNENDIIISLTKNVYYFDKSGRSYYRETKKNKELLAECSINITLRSFETYKEAQEEKKKKKNN